MGFRLLGALEALEDLDEVDAVETNQPTEPDDLDTTLLSVMDDEVEFDESSSDVTDGVDTILDGIDSSIEKLEAIVEVINKHGISKSMMMAADPNGELVSNGICPSYEELNDAPVHDSNAVAAIEGITDTLSNVWKRISDFFVVIGTKLSAFAVKTKQLFISYEKALASAERSVGDIDPEKFGAKQISCYGKADFGTAHKVIDLIMKVVNSGGLEKAAAEFEGYLKGTGLTEAHISDTMKKVGSILKPLANNKDVAEAAGISVKFSESGEFESVGSAGITIKPTRKSVNDHGWKAADVSKAIKDAKGVVSNYTVSVKHVEIIARLCKDASAILKSQAKSAGSFDAEKKAAYKAAVNGTRKVIMANRAILMAAIVCPRSLASSALQLAKAASN